MSRGDDRPTTAVVDLSDQALDSLQRILREELMEAFASMLSSTRAHPLVGTGRGSKLLTASEVAQRLGRSAGWVRQHRDELGVINVGRGTRPRLLFRAEAVARSLTSRSESERSQKPESPARTTRSRARTKPRSGRNVELLPFPGSERLKKPPDPPNTARHPKRSEDRRWNGMTLQPISSSSKGSPSM